MLVFLGFNYWNLEIWDLDDIQFIHFIYLFIIFVISVFSLKGIEILLHDVRESGL